MCRCCAILLLVGLCKSLVMQKAFLSDEQWKKIEPLLPQEKSRGRSWADSRRILEWILWVLKTGARWRDLPAAYPSASTC